MKASMVSTLDRLVPLVIKRNKKTEELNRARAFISVLLITLLATCIFFFLSLLGFQLSQSPADPNLLLRITFGIVGHVCALLIFLLTGRYLVSGNIFAFTFYYTLFFTVLAWPGQISFGIMLYFFALPLLAAFITSYRSAMVWLFMVTAAPLLLNYYGEAGFEVAFIVNWVAACAGLFVIVYTVYGYIQHLSQRLNHQCNLLEFAATHDSLTDLPNRASFQACLEECVERCKQYSNKMVLAYIDLNKFKPINDHYGHHTGDQVLKSTANRLRSLVRDIDVVARLGGDEFAIIFDRCTLQEAQPILERVMRGIAEPIVIDNHHLAISCSIGTVVCPDDGLNTLDLTREADERMYKTKRSSSSSR